MINLDKACITEEYIKIGNEIYKISSLTCLLSSEGCEVSMQLAKLKTKNNELKIGDYVQVIDKNICNTYGNVSADNIYKIEYKRQELGALKYVKLCGIDIMFREDVLKKVEVVL